MLGTRKLPFKSILEFQRLRYQVHDRRGPRKAQDLWGGGLCSHLRGVTKMHGHTWTFLSLDWSRKILHADATEMTCPLPSIKAIYGWLWSYPSILATQ